MTKDDLNILKEWKWSDKRRRVARALAEGTKSQVEISIDFKISETSISTWKAHPDFIKYVDELTLSLEKHTVAGILRRIDEQQEKTAIGKNEWAKLEEMRIKLLGHDKQKVEHSGEVGFNLKWNTDEDDNNPVQSTSSTKEVS